MTRQYMDFAPRRTATQRKTVPTQAVKGATGRMGVQKQAARTVVQKQVSKKPTVRVAEAGTFTTERKPALGAIEDLTPKFVRTDVPKRPLGANGTHFKTTKTGAKAVKAKKVGVTGLRTGMGVKSVEKPVEKSKKTTDDGAYKVPKTPFINQGKVQKRPLSKNVYAKKKVVPKKEPQGPVTIISQPEKQAHVGLIVTIILTIILGAAAGTVAFLLLPK